MGPNQAKLLEISSGPLAEKPEANTTVYPGDAAPGLSDLLTARNGFFAFENALHVYPIGDRSAAIELTAWNAPDGWRSAYDADLAQAVFFAQDVFGGQFCFLGGRIRMFNPETAEFEDLAATLEEWAKQVLSDYDYLTGHSLAHSWQVLHGALPPEQRLVPIRPFVLGGAYDVENLHALEATKSMALRADLSNQIADLPDGASVRYSVRD